MDKKTSRKRQQLRKGKQTAKSMFIRGFLQSFFIVAILLTAGVIGYQVTMKLWRIEPEEIVVEEKPEPTPVPITVASVDEVSKNLIFCYNSETHIINKLVLEVFHCEKKQLTYITIPLSTQFTMSDILYKKLIAVQPSIPQIFRLSTMTRYLDSEVVFDYGTLMIEDLLDLDISYYTVIPLDLYQSVFEERSIRDGATVSDIMAGENAPISGDGDTDFPIVAEVFTEKYIEELGEISSVEELSTYIETTYEDIISNLSVKEKMNYLESYSKTSLNDVSFTRVAGNDRNSGYVVDESRMRQQLQSLEVY